MRRVHLAIAAAFALLSACAQSSSGHQAGTKTPRDCAPFIDSGSALAVEVAGYDDQPTCETRYGPQGRYVEAFGVTGIAKARETEELKGQKSLIIIFRYFHSDESAVPVNSADITGDKNFRVVSTELPIRLINSEGLGRVARFEGPGDDITHVCVTGITNNPDDSRTLVEMCRPVGTLASDEAVLKQAAEIATTAFPSVNP